jgi:mannose-1-phosphate guanylyltransferase
MQALVLAGGEGTRLRPLTLTRPKPALRLVDRPFVRFMIDWVSRHGVDEVVMACGFRAEDLRGALGDEIPGEARIRYVEEPEPLGTAGPVRLAADRGLLDERFMVLNGDLLTDLDLSALQATHSERRARATIALHAVDDPSAYGLVRRGADDEVLGFLEKPDPEQIDTDEVNAGAYVLERGVLDLIPAGRAVSIERDVFPRLVGQGLYGRRLEGYWTDIGTPERYLQASWDILEGRVESDVSAHEDGVLIEPDASVAPGAAVGPCAVVGSRCEIEDGATVYRSVLHDDCRVEAKAEVHGSILGQGVQVGEGARVGPGSVVGDGARIAAGAVLGDDARVAPEAVVTA